MFVRGVDEPIEYNRNDTTIYKGIVVKNNDPYKLFRVKVFIPELSNQPLENWLAEYSYFLMRFPGKNNKTDSWKDTKIFEQIADGLPWAEPCYPIMGESGPGRYNSPNEIATISDTNYGDYFEANNETPPTALSGVFSPSWFYENKDTTLNDAFCVPDELMTVNNNPYAFLGRPSMNVNNPKGVYGVPSVGSKVWVFLYNGDVNFPVYFGTRHDFRETSLDLSLNQPNCKDQSLDYPDIFENAKNTK